MDGIFNQILTLTKPQSSIQIAAKAPLFTELLVSHAAQHRPIILVAKSHTDFLLRLKNLRFFLQGRPLSIRTLPPDERTVMHATSADPLVRMERAATRFHVAASGLPNILLVTAPSLVERSPSALDWQKHAKILIKGEKLHREHFIQSLLLLGYAKVSQVLDRGTFAVRGSVIDIFINGEQHPIRVDLFGDDVESIKYFDENTQRS